MAPAREPEADGDELLRVGERVPGIGTALLRLHDERRALPEGGRRVPQDTLLLVEWQQVQDVDDGDGVALGRWVGDDIPYFEAQPPCVADRPARDLDLPRVEIDPQDPARVGGLAEHAGE